MTLEAVQLLVKTTIRHGQEIENIEQNVEATLYDKGRFLYVQYVEKLSEHLAPVKTTLKIAANEMKIIRNGQVKMNQRFIENETTTGSYLSPYGHFQMITDTTHYKREWIKQKVAGRIQLTYTLRFNENEVGVYTLEIEIGRNKNEYY